MTQPTPAEVAAVPSVLKRMRFAQAVCDAREEVKELLSRYELTDEQRKHLERAHQSLKRAQYHAGRAQYGDASLSERLGRAAAERVERGDG